MDIKRITIIFLTKVLLYCQVAYVFMAKEINLNELLDNLYNADIKNKSEINWDLFFFNSHMKLNIHVFLGKTCPFHYELDIIEFFLVISKIVNVEFLGQVGQMIVLLFVEGVLNKLSLIYPSNNLKKNCNIGSCIN